MSELTAHFEKYETEVKLLKKLYSTAFQGVNMKGHWFIKKLSFSEFFFSDHKFLSHQSD